MPTYRRNLIIALITLSLLCIGTAGAYAAGLTIPSGSAIKVNTGTLNVAGNISNAGTLLLTTGAIALSGNWANTGTFTAGTGTVNFTAGTGVTQTLNSGGTGAGKLFYHLTHSGAGTLQLVTNAIDIDGNFTNSAGTFDANGLAISCAGNWSNTDTFTSNNNSLTLDGTNQTFSGSTTFYNLTCNTPSAQLTFTKNTTYTINNTLTLNGQRKGTEITLRSSENGSSYTLDFPNGAQTIIHVDLKDCTAGTNASTARNSVNSGGNTNWTFRMVDPYGIVFDSVSNNPVKGATVTLYYDNDPGAGRSWISAVAGTHIASGDANPQTTGTDGSYAYNCINGDYYLDIAATGYTYPSTKSSFPAGRTITTGSKGEVFTVSGGVLEIDQPMDANTLLLKVKKDANKKEVVVGDVVTYTVTIQNETNSDVTNVYLEDKIPAGFKYISGKAILDNVPISDPTGNRPLTFNIGTVSAGTTKTLKYQLVVGSGVTFGNYENSAWAKYSDGTVISNKATETVKVVPDPLFDLGTIIGKVFWDFNENGKQDSLEVRRPMLDAKASNVQHLTSNQFETGIPNVQIATEDGTLIITDEDGKFHLAAVIPGRHLFRLDERTLPDGAHLTTDKVVIVDITPGIISKVNFGVKLKEETDIRQAPCNITQDKNTPKPRLNLALFNEEIILKDDKLKEPAEFRIFTNYQLFIEEWEIEILDKDTRALVKSFKGLGCDILEPIIWDGKDENGKLIIVDRNYIYRLIVTGKDGCKDTTKEKGLVVREIIEEEDSSADKIEKEKQEWIEKENQVNILDKQDIGIKGETIKVTSNQKPVTSIKIIKGGRPEVEIPVIESEGLTAKDLLKSQSGKGIDEQSEVEIILPKGEYDIEIIGEPVGDLTDYQPANRQTGQQANRQTAQQTYIQHLKIGDDYLFFVGMGDAKMGYTVSRGNIEPVQQDDKFRDGFWSEGKLAYYLKGKIKGKYLITSSLDTDRDKKELFRNLDPDKYYPVYGDSSSVNYDATNTQGPLYLLVEWDKSSAIWGNYNTALIDTEFAAFNRTLYGGKIDYEDVSTTQFGEPKTKLVVFKARAQQKAAHNEFIGTGGSLYYLKNKDVIEGSDKVKIEIRDKITGLVLATEEMEGGVDYEIDYSNGRIIFWKPVSQVSESDSIISGHLLDGNPVYVVADYEYEMKDKYDEGTYGGCIQQSLTDYLRIGGVYVKEEQLNKNYELKATDTIVHLGRDTKLTAEYAQTQSEEVGSFISTDGGLSFTELANGDLDKGKAYGLKGESYLFDKLGLTSYYKKIEKGFSSTSTTSQQGKELMGAGATLDLTSKTRLKATHDTQRLIDDGNLQAQLQVGAHKTETSAAQITHEMEKLRLAGEYRHQEVTEKKEQFESETNAEEDTAAVKAEYKATDKVNLSLEQQATLKGAPNHQTTAGLTAKVNEHLSLRAKETIGTQGTATSVGATVNSKERFELSGDYTRTDYEAKAGGVSTSDTASVSGKAKVDDRTQVYTTYAVTDSFIDGKTQSVVYGSKRKVNEELELTTDRTYAKNRDSLTQANALGLTKEKDGKKLEGTFTEQRFQSNTEVSNTNIFGLSGDIDDKWAALGNFERGIVQNHDGTQADRNAGAIGVSFLDKDPLTQAIKLKASSKLELRLDEGQQDKRQFVIYNAVEGKVNSNTTLFAKTNVSQTKNATTDSTEVQYKELVTGIAYRPVNFDRLNLLGKYAYLEDDSPGGQSDFSDIEKEKAHVFGSEAVYDLTDKWQISEKLAYKMGEEKVSGFDFTETQTWLMVHRLSYNLYKDWQVSGEYRMLTQRQAEDRKQGALVEVAREIGEFIQVGIGYNFTDFSDDLTCLDYTTQGPFIRITGKFYERTR